MKIVVGQKILNLEELYQVSEAHGIELEIDAQIFAELDCKAIDKKFETEVPASHKGLKLPLNQVRGFIVCKIIQLLKLKASA
jgi:hypothetical protein